MSSPFDYDYIRPLLTRSEVSGSTLDCRFTCPVTGRGFNATIDLSSLPPSTEESEGGVWAGLRYSFGSALASILGTRPARQTAFAGETAAGALHERGVERAFRNISTLFRWDRKRERWIGVDSRIVSQTRFEEQLNVHPIAPDHFSILFRMLTAVAQADGVFGEVERAFLRPFFPATKAALDELAARGRPEPDELRSIRDPGERQSALMICWAAALCDEELAPAEERLVEEFAVDLHIEAGRTAELRRFAKRYLVQRVVQEVLDNFTMNIAEEDRVIRVGAKLGLPLSETQEIVQEYRERWGLN